MTKAEQLTSLFMAGVDAVRGYNAVRKTLAEKQPEPPTLIIAVGKAAGDMALGARAHFSAPIETIVVTKYGHVSEELSALPACEIYESAHPIPDKNSLLAGARLRDAVTALPSSARLLLLISGGGSSLVEVLSDHITLEDLGSLNQRLIAEGKDIAQINTQRKKLSLIKDGKLLDQFGGQAADVIAISDVEGDSIRTIASGIGAYNGADDRVTITIAASNKIAREAVAAACDLPIIINEEALYTSAEDAAEYIHSAIADGAPGLYIFGGEPTIVLPDKPGRGGRNQHLALLLAEKIKGGKGITILVAGTDGTDGPTDDAGAIIDGRTVPLSDNVAPYLVSADAGSYLAARNALLTTGPTGTNVMDLVITIKD